MTIKNYSVVEAKKHFSEILGRVAYGGERVLISKRGKALAMIIPSAEKPGENHLSKVQGWLDDADPFFNLMEQTAREREKHAPRISRHRRD
jgi:prevent-host-death family protein